MSTRSMTLVEQLYDRPGKYVALYRHCDGYPACAGASILEAIRGTEKPTCENIVSSLLAADDAEYRLATWMPEDQGDLEHVYVLTRSPGTSWEVIHYARPRGAWGAGHELYSRWPQRRYTLAEFVDVVNRDRQGINRRLEQLRKQQPGVYGDAEPYAMLSA